MSDTISTYLNKIRNAKYGTEVLAAICGGLEACYDDVSSSSLKLDAFKTAIQELKDSGALAGLTLGDGSITNSKLADGSVTKNKLDPSVTFNMDAATQKALLDLLEKVDYTSENGKILYKRLKSTLEMDTFSKPKIMSVDLTEDAYTTKHYLMDDVSKHSYPVSSNNTNECHIYPRYYQSVDDFNEGVGNNGFTILVRVIGDLSVNDGDVLNKRPLLRLQRFYYANSWQNYTIGVVGVGQYKTTTNSNAQTGFTGTDATPPVKWSTSNALPKPPYTLIMSVDKTGAIVVWLNGEQIATGQFANFSRWDTSWGFWGYPTNPTSAESAPGTLCHMKSYDYYDKLIVYEGAFSDSEAKTINDFFRQ